MMDAGDPIMFSDPPAPSSPSPDAGSETRPCECGHTKRWHHSKGWCQHNGSALRSRNGVEAPNCECREYRPVSSPASERVNPPRERIAELLDAYRDKLFALDGAHIRSQHAAAMACVEARRALDAEIGLVCRDAEKAIVPIDEQVVRHENGHLRVERAEAWTPSRDDTHRWITSCAKALPYLAQHAQHIDGEFDLALTNLRRGVDALHEYVERVRANCGLPQGSRAVEFPPAPSSPSTDG